jgi:hypothetical protein
MKMPIIAFLIVFMYLGGVPSSADDAMSTLSSGSDTEASLSVNAPDVESDATTTSAPNTAIMLLIATGLVGLAGVSRRKDS